MRPYSDFPVRRTLQIIADAAAALVVVLAIVAGTAVHGAIAALAGVMHHVEEAGIGLRNTLLDVGESIGTVPLVGDSLRGPFDAASGAGDTLASAGRAAQSLVETIAVWAGIGVAAAPIAILLLVWFWPRMRFVRRAAETRALLGMEDGMTLLALRALDDAKAADLARVSPRVVTAWQEGDQEVIHSLAALEARTSGVRLAPGRDDASVTAQ